MVLLSWKYTTTCYFWSTVGVEVHPCWCATAPGRFAQKPVPPGTIRLGRFAQNFERDCSHNITGTVRSKFNLLGQFILFNFKKKNKLLRLSVHLFWMNNFNCWCWILFMLRKIKQSISINWPGHNQSLAMIKHI